MEAAEAEILFSDHLPKAYSTADYYCRKFSSLRPLKEDVRSESACGLWEACLRYTPSPTNKFWTFAFWRVRGSIVTYARRQKIFLRDWEIESGRKNIVIVSLDGCLASGGDWKSPSTYNNGRYVDRGKSFSLEDKSSDIEINKIDVSRMIDSGTNGMSKDKKQVMKRYFCDGMNVPDMSKEYGTAERFAWAAIREGIEELKSSIGDVK